MKLISNGPVNPFNAAPLIAADLANVRVETVFLTEEQRNDKEWKAKHLSGKYPVLETDCGELLFESAAIAQYLVSCAPGAGFYGSSAFEAAKCDEWIAWAQTAPGAQLRTLLYAVFGHKVVPQSEFNDVLKTLKGNMKVLDTYLKGKHYLVGDRLSVADVAVACALMLAFQTVFEAGYRKAIPNVTAWFERCIALPSFIRRLGYVKLAEKGFKAFDPNAKPAPAPKQEVKKEEPKQEPKQETKKEEDDMDDLFGDDDEEDTAAQEEAKEAAKKAAEAAKKKKKVVIEKSLILLEVKPQDDETNLDDLYKRIVTTIQKDGLMWKQEYKKEPVAFGIFKLIIGFVIEDAKISPDNDVIEPIELMEDMVQSVDIKVFDKCS